MTIDLPLAVHDGRPEGGASFSRCNPRPDAFITWRRHSVLCCRRKAMRVPSGDHTGKMSWAPEVSLRTPLPSRFITKIPEASRANATRFPFGENAGSVAGFL